MKIIINVIIIGLIGLLSSTYLFDISPINYKNSIEIQTPVETSELRLEIENETIDFLNPKSIVIKHTSNTDEVLKSLSQNIFTANIYKDNKLIHENISNLELVNLSSNTTLTINKDNPMVTTLDISQEKLKLDDGTYKIVLQSNLIADSKYSSIDIQVTYDTAGTYVPALNAAPVGTKGLTIYFTSEKLDTLIPVTKFSIEDKSITRMAIEQLQNGPSDTNMKTIIGDVTNCTYNNGNVVIDLPSSYNLYNNVNIGTLAYNAFVKTIFDVDRYWPIYSVSFTIDRKKVETYFNGIDTSKAIPNTEYNYSLYLAYKVNERYYLFDLPIDAQAAGINKNDSTEIKAQKLFDYYSDVKLTYGRNPIPNDVKLNTVTIEGRNLILDFNEKFTNSYNNKDDLKLMMIESLIYSFTSIPNVDGIQITVNKKPLTNFVKDRDLSGILTPPKFINPEITN
ncbi:MAG: GerMN domain-containing protein [Clostridia bacterium]|nr:GerMN domain-containing protein [Clostridia bacterium]